MKQSFCDHHILEIFEKFQEQNSPLDGFLNNYFRKHKSLGAHDRKNIALTVYGIIRWQKLLDYLLEKPSWGKRIFAFKNFSWQEFINNSSIPLNVRVSFPECYFQLLKEHYGEEQTKNICLVSNQQAPVTVRVNILKISRDQLFSRWEKKYEVKLTEKSNVGITFLKRENFFGMDEFKQGFFELQDEASQLVAMLIKASSKHQVLDFCAGSGGKTLAFAPYMKNKGQIHLYDNRPFMLMQAKKRLKRAGIQNAQLILDKQRLQKIKVDWLLLDVPCSGSGTLRRNPDSKWRFSLDFLNSLVQKQREIFKESISLLKDGGKIVYSTCSILPQENEEQIKFFTQEYGLKLVKNPFFTLPVENGMDGFFGVVLEKK